MKYEDQGSVRDKGKSLSSLEGTTVTPAQASLGFATQGMEEQLTLEQYQRLTREQRRTARNTGRVNQILGHVAANKRNTK